jgi:hypothetical protein
MAVSDSYITYIDILGFGVPPMLKWANIVAGKIFGERL